LSQKGKASDPEVVTFLGLFDRSLENLRTCNHLLLLFQSSNGLIHGNKQNEKQKTKKDFPEGDPYHQIERYKGRFCGFFLKDMESVRTIYDDVLKTSGSSVDIWLEYIGFERQLSELDLALNFENSLSFNVKFFSLELWVLWKKQEPYSEKLRRFILTGQNDSSMNGSPLKGKMAHSKGFFFLSFIFQAGRPFSLITFNFVFSHALYLFIYFFFFFFHCFFSQAMTLRQRRSKSKWKLSNSAV